MTNKYKIEFNKGYLKDLKKIPIRAQKQIREKIQNLSLDPRPEGCKKLQGSSNPALYRVRCGDYRIIYTIEDHVLLVIIIQVGNRKEIYR